MRAPASGHSVRELGVSLAVACEAAGIGVGRESGDVGAAGRWLGGVRCSPGERWTPSAHRSAHLAVIATHGEAPSDVHMLSG
jgi:hypothetical protein